MNTLLQSSVYTMNWPCEGHQSIIKIGQFQKLPVQTKTNNILLGSRRQHTLGKVKLGFLRSFRTKPHHQAVSNILADNIIMEECGLERKVRVGIESALWTRIVDIQVGWWVISKASMRSPFLCSGRRGRTILPEIIIPRHSNDGRGLGRGLLLIS